MAGAVNVTISANWERWQNGLRRFGQDTAEAAESTFRQAGEVFLSESQNRAHVLSGDMLSTGRLEEETMGDEISVNLVYGGIPGASGRIVDYALFEEQRGGSHAFMSLAWASTERMFAEAIPDAFEQVVATWR